MSRNPFSAELIVAELLVAERIVAAVTKRARERAHVAEEEPLPATRAQIAVATSFWTAARRSSGLNGLTIHPRAPACLACWRSSGCASVVSMITGIPAP